MFRLLALIVMVVFVATGYAASAERSGICQFEACRVR